MTGLKDTHRSVIAAAYENLAGTNQVHRAILRLLEPVEFEDFLRTLGEDVAEILRVDHITLVLETTVRQEDPAVEKLGGVLTVVEPGVIDAYLSQDRGGPARDAVLRPVQHPNPTIFGAMAGRLRSEACLRLDLGKGRLPGMVVMGAKDPEPFHTSIGHRPFDVFRGRVRTLDAPLAVMSLISPACRDALQHWLDSLGALAGRSENTQSAYRGDVTEFLSFMTLHHSERQGLAALARITVADMRAWMADQRSSGVGARSLARKLSAVKSFYRWLSEREGFEPTAVLSTRAPKFTKKLPRPLAEDAARAMIDTVEMQSANDWVSARDVAVVTLLYGCGLRISEALSLTGADAPLPENLRIVGKGDKERIVPVLPAARAAVDRYLQLCPHPQARDKSLFRERTWRPAERARHSGRDGQGPDATWPARNGHPPRHATQLCHASFVGRGRPARDTRAVGPRLALDDTSLYGGRYRAVDGSLQPRASKGVTSS